MCDKGGLTSTSSNNKACIKITSIIAANSLPPPKVKKSVTLREG